METEQKAYWVCVLVGRVPWPGIPNPPVRERRCGLRHDSRERADRCGSRAAFEVWESREIVEEVSL